MFLRTYKAQNVFVLLKILTLRITHKCKFRLDFEYFMSFSASTYGNNSLTTHFKINHKMLANKLRITQNDILVSNFIL